VLRGERGPVSAYCDSCRENRQRELARLRVQEMRARRGAARPLSGPLTTGELRPEGAFPASGRLPRSSRPDASLPEGRAGRVDLATQGVLPHK